MINYYTLKLKHLFDITNFICLYVKLEQGLVKSNFDFIVMQNNFCQFPLFD